MDSGHAACGAQGGDVALSDGISCPRCLAILDDVDRSLPLAFPTRRPNGAIHRDPYMEEGELKGMLHTIERVIDKKRAEGTLPPPRTP